MMRSIGFAVLWVVFISGSVRADTECDVKFLDFLAKYQACFTSSRTVLTKPIFHQLEQLYNKEVTEEDFVQYKIENCPRLSVGLDCVLDIDVPDEDKACASIAGILNRFHMEKISSRYICALNNETFVNTINNGGVDCLLKRAAIGTCVDNKASAYDGQPDRCLALKLKKECLAGIESCVNGNVDKHASAILDAIAKDLNCVV